MKSSIHSAVGSTSNARRPILLFDIMDTVVADPFFETMPAFFDMTFKELLECKHPTAWIEFETAVISQEELFSKFFADGRKFNGPGLVAAMEGAYCYKDGMERLLQRLHAAGYDVHAMSNYPEWWKLIEEKLKLSHYLSWTFLSCEGPMLGKRKPNVECYTIAVSHLNIVNPEYLILVDDRRPNIEAAMQAGLKALHFKDAAQLEQDLLSLGLQF